MKRSNFSEEQVAYALRQAEAGTAVPHVCRQAPASTRRRKLLRLLVAVHAEPRRALRGP